MSPMKNECSSLLSFFFPSLLIVLYLSSSSFLLLLDFATRHVDIDPSHRSDEADMPS